MSTGAEFSLMDLFREEVRSHSATLGQGLLELEGQPDDPRRIEPLMRAAHSIKGAARIVNIEPAVHLAHVLEDVLVAAQQGRLRLGPPDVDLLLRGNDVLAELAKVDEDGVAGWAAAQGETIRELQGLLQPLARGERPEPPPPPAPVAPPPVQEAPVPAESGQGQMSIGAEFSLMDLFREEVRGHSATLGQGLLELEGQPDDPRRIEPLMRAAHSIKGAARIVNIEPAVHLAHALEDVLVAAQQGRLRLGPADVDLLLRGTDVLAELAKVEEDGVAGWAGARGEAIRELQGLLQPLARGERSTPAREVVPALEPEPSPPAPVVPPPPVPVPAQEAPVPAEAAPPPVPAPSDGVVRVTAESLTRLMGLAGESLVQARWLGPFSGSLLKLKRQQDRVAALLDRLAQAVAAGEPADRLAGLVEDARGQLGRCRQTLAGRRGEFDDHAARAEDLNSRLYHEVIASRMRPFADGSHGFPRLVRDLARRLGKPVRLEIDGQATEVDRDVLDRLEAPLTHLLRNAVDHGIEPAEERRAAGKPEAGLVRLQARHRAGMLAVSVSDDGAGVDLERLRRKVVERRLTTAEVAGSLGEAELLEFLFLPGFSTAAAVTETSGRGVGLDVVQDAVRKTGGSVRITTRPGQGTRFDLLLPVTLSVLRAVLVEIAGEPYAFPLHRIDRLVRVPRGDVRSVENRQFVTLDGQNVGLVLAAQLLDFPADPPAGDELPVVQLSDPSGHYGLIVEAFRGEQDLVVRPLDPRLGKVPNVSAAAILDDGTPVLIADVEDLIRSMDRYIQGGSLRRCDREAPAAVRAPRRVLVVDDSITVRELERQLLRAHGYDVTVAVDGQEGWNLVRGGGFDLVVSDVDMPRMNGLELVRAVRADPALRDLPLVIVSYKEREEDRLRGLEAGASYYLTKSSFHDNTFLQAVTDLIGEA